MTPEQLLPFLLMDKSLELTDSIFLNNPDSYLETPSFRYYTIPYGKQINKYFRMLFTSFNNDSVYIYLDNFDLYISPFLTDLYKNFVELFKEEFPYIIESDLHIISTLHCNSAILHLTQEYYKRFLKKSCSQISDLIAYNSNILNKLPIKFDHKLDLNKVSSIKLSAGNLTNQFINYLKILKSCH